jgi:addiction module HigA family antidote
LEPHGLNSYDVAAKLKISPSTFNRLINEKSRVSPIIALKLSNVLGSSPESWLAMQCNLDLHKAGSEIEILRYVPIKF